MKDEINEILESFREMHVSLSLRTLPKLLDCLKFHEFIEFFITLSGIQPEKRQRRVSFLMIKMTNV